MVVTPSVARKSSNIKEKAAWLFKLSSFFNGRSDRIRTCGIDVPNVARYQLRYTPITDNYTTYYGVCQQSRLRICEIVRVKLCFARRVVK